MDDISLLANDWLLGKTEVAMNASNRVLLVTTVLIISFGAMFFGALYGEVSGKMSRDQVTTLLGYSLPFLGMAVVAALAWHRLESRDRPH